MQDKIVTLETAKLAREKEFDIHSDYRYVENEAKSQHKKDLINWKDYRVEECIDYNKDYAYKSVERLKETYNEIFKNNDKGYYLSAPTQNLLQKWLREKHNILVYCLPTNEGNSWYYQISIFPDECITQFDLENKYSYEQALEEGLYEALKLIKNEILCKN